MSSRIPRIVVVAAVLAGASLLVPAVPAADARVSGVPVTESWVLPSSSLVVTGRGYGHGRGMSQWGAVNAAIDGAAYKTILRFYYPGTSFSTISARLRVLITADRDDNLTVKHVAGLRVVDLGNDRTYRLRTRTTPRAWRMKTVYGKTRLYYRTAKWHLYRTGGRVALKGAGQFRSTTGPLTLKMHSGNRRYRGALRFVKNDTVNVVSLEGYLKGVVPAEMPASWRAAALRAQAVAARTYALWKRSANLGGYYQICDTTSCQVYGGYDVEDARTNQAVAATAGQYLTYAGKPALTEFSSSSGGWTSSGGVPYLPSKADTYDHEDNDPHYPWADPDDPPVTVNTARLAARHPELGQLQRLRVTRREGSGEWLGRVEEIQLDGTSDDDVRISGDDFRSLYGLKSTYFTFTP